MDIFEPASKHMYFGFRVGESVKLLPASASTVIPSFSLLEIHDRDFDSLLDMYVFELGHLYDERVVGLSV
jgi:hypothetical protein